MLHMDFRYFKRKDGLPNPKGSLSKVMLSAVISQVNKEVAAAATSSDSHPECKKCEPYKRQVAAAIRIIHLHN